MDIKKVEEDNRCLKNDKNLLEEKINNLKKDKGHRRFENAAFVDILAFFWKEEAWTLPSSTMLDIDSLSSIVYYRNMVIKIQQLLQKSSTESN